MNATRGFNDAGELEPTTGPDWDAIDPDDRDDAEAPSADRAEILTRFLEMLTAPTCGRLPAPVVVGRRAVLLGYLLDGARESQRSLAERLGLSPARTSQLVNAAKRDFAMLARVS